MKKYFFLCGMTFLAFSGYVIAEPLSNSDSLFQCENLLDEENEHALRAKQMDLKPLNKIRSACCCKKGQRGAIGPVGLK